MDADPIANIQLVADPERSFVVIMQERQGLQEIAETSKGRARGHGLSVERFS